MERSVLIGLLAGVIFAIGYLTGQSSVEFPPPPDYYIDLEQDSIVVQDDRGYTYVVHPDSLEEFLIEDNL